MTLPRVALTEFLRETNIAYFAKLDELRGGVERWLEYVPQTFPHYTRHGVAHSDEILTELSQVLFRDGDLAAPAVQLSSAEVYILCAAAYLHDTGMVVADREKLEILSSDAWRKWTSGGGGGAKRWAEVQAFRASAMPEDSQLRHFLADVQTRFLIAEFVRRVHHLRARSALAEHQELANCAFGDPGLLRTIADVCVAHGLEVHEIENAERYPDRRTIRGEQVNVRFLALLLRLGDLLDMSSPRACPLLMAAASPLPVDSVGHWSQYQRIVHRVTAPDRIEIIAECESQEEHRLLQDWCTWLVQELHTAQLMMARAARHSQWTAPEAKVDQPGATIKIRPAVGARYRPSRWAFELDATMVFERLIRDVYQFPLSFVRELLQNALDANRTRMYADMRDAGEPLPGSPTLVAAEWRVKYPVTVSIAEETVRNALSEEDEIREVVTVEDHGTGMDSDIIERYLLQIGRSFYNSKEFLDHYPFVPTSRFGIGFLSVFAVSEHVVVDTYQPLAAADGGPIRLTLTGPRAYLLTEAGSRTGSGTRVSVRLRDRLEVNDLAKLLRHWCKRVEFPVVFRAGGREMQIESEQPRLETFTAAGEDGAQVVVSVRAFPVAGNGIEGDVYVAALTDAIGESWAERYKVRQLAKGQPLVGGSIPPRGWVALHGINMAPPRRFDMEEDEWDDHTNSMQARLDIRGRAESVSLARVTHSDNIAHNYDLLRALEPTYAQILDEHMATTPYAHGEWSWLYKQKLADEFPLPTYWLRVPGLLRGFRDQRATLLTIEEVLAERRVRLVVGTSRYHTEADPQAELNQAVQMSRSDLTLAGSDLWLLTSLLSWGLFENRPISQILLESDAYPVVVFSENEPHLQPIVHVGPFARAPVYVAQFPTQDVLCISLHRDFYYSGPLVLNELHPYTDWIRGLVAEILRDDRRVSAVQVRKFLGLLAEVTGGPLGRPESVSTFIRAWRDGATFPADLTPPDTDFDVAWIGGAQLRTPRRTARRRSLSKE